jgi:dGTPase
MNHANLHEKAETLHGCLSAYATTTCRRIRVDDEDAYYLNDEFVGDEAKIFSSKPFRNMGFKTQVATLPTNTLIRTRLAHVVEVTATSVILADKLGLNKSLTRAIALGHDIGHVPFGHQGEKFMAKAMGKPFCHEVMGVVVAQKIERRGRGMNLSHQTLEGMMCHSGDLAEKNPHITPEAWVVRYADKITYLTHDYNDIVRMGYPVRNELKVHMEFLGRNQRERATALMSALIIESAEKKLVRFDDGEFAARFKKIRKLMYEIYDCVTQQDPKRIMEPVLEFLTRQKIGDPFLLLALMTDKDVIALASQPMVSFEHLKQTAVFEIIPYLKDICPVDLCDPSLNW